MTKNFKTLVSERSFSHRNQLLSNLRADGLEISRSFHLNNKTNWFTFDCKSDSSIFC